MYNEAQYVAVNKHTLLWYIVHIEQRADCYLCWHVDVEMRVIIFLTLPTYLYGIVGIAWYVVMQVAGALTGAKMHSLAKLAVAYGDMHYACRITWL